MANVDSIVTTMQEAQNAIAMQMGIDLTSSSVEIRTIVRICDAMVAVVIGALVDQQVPRGNGQPLTLATFSAALNNALGQTYTQTGS